MAATVGELRSLRRWLVVAGVWAVAASAIAIIALLAANDDDSKRTPRAVTGSQLSGVQRDLDERIDALEKQVKGLPRSDDVSKLEDRLKTAEDRANAARSDVKAARTDVDDLQQKVDDLQQQQDQSSQGDSGNGATTTP